MKSSSSVPKIVDFHSKGTCWAACSRKHLSPMIYPAWRIARRKNHAMSILIAEDNVAQRAYLRELLGREFARYKPILEAGDGESVVKMALAERPQLCILDIQMPGLSGVKAARSIWKSFPEARIISWTQFPHEFYTNEIRKIVRAVHPPPAYGFIDKNNPESRFLRFVAAVLEDGADMIDPNFKDAFT